MTGVAGLLENFNYYYGKLMDRSVDLPLYACQRNTVYEQYRMSEAFYLSALCEAELSPSDRRILEMKFGVLTELVQKLQQRAGDFELQAV